MSNNYFHQSRKLTRSKFLRLFVLGGSSAAILGACSSNSTTTTSASPTSSASSASSPSPASSSAATPAGKPLVIGTEGTYPPFSFKDLQTGELAGYDIEIAQEIAKRLGRKVEFVPTQWKSMLASLEAKRFDLVANQVGITPEREQKLLFSKPYTISGSLVIVSKDNPKKIQGVADLKGKTVGTTQGSNYADAAKKAGAEVSFYPGAAQALTDLENNRVDAVLNDRLFVLTELKKTGYKVQAVGEVFSKDEIGFAFHKENTQLRDDFNKVLEELRKDGTLTKISKKWFGEDVSN